MSQFQPRLNDIPLVHIPTTYLIERSYDLPTFLSPIITKTASNFKFFHFSYVPKQYMTIDLYEMKDVDILEADV